MSSCIGILQEYAVGDDWEDYTDRLKQYFVANKMDTNEDAEMWRAVLLTICGAPEYSLIRDLAPAKPSDKSYEELVNLMKRHYHPKPNGLTDRGETSQKCSPSLDDTKFIKPNGELPGQGREEMMDHLNGGSQHHGGLVVL
uniref:Uncharacterized protein n=1 Tax=Eptatretus burgeri TaxID=7764 RepID=A0A8C4Q5L8_EPTBU